MAVSSYGVRRHGADQGCGEVGALEPLSSYDAVSEAPVRWGSGEPWMPRAGIDVVIPVPSAAASTPWARAHRDGTARERRPAAARHEADPSSS
ncbi:hypothetical protein SUDANB38_03545 [Streptomyces sp. enrichment culture]